MKKNTLIAKAFFRLGDKTIESEEAKLIVYRYDFVPIVKLNTDHNDVMEKANALWSTKSCKTSKKQILTLSDAFDISLREYTIPEIVIAKNSKALIPLENILGYDPWGFQDEDGILEFKPIKTISIKMLDEECPNDVDTTTKEYDFKKAEVGDEYCLQISHNLGRGEKFSIEVFAQDENEDNQDKKRKCGKLNFTVVQKDVFLKDEAQRVVDENDDLRVTNIWNQLWGSADKVCFRVADKQFANVVDNNSLVLKSYTNLSAYDRMDDYKSKSYIKSTRRFKQSKIWIRDKEGDYKLKPKSFRSGKDTVFSDYINEGVENKIGYHLYYFALLNAYHVLTILVNNADPCKTQYKILDQLKDRSWENLDYLNKDLLNMTIRNYNSACDKAKRKDHDSSIQLWKLKRK